MVIGPTPPGTGVRKPAKSATPASTSPLTPASVRVMPDVHDSRAPLDHVHSDHAGEADGGNEDVRVEGVARKILRAGVTDRHRRVRLQEEQRHRLADERAAPDHDGPLTSDAGCGTRRAGA